MSFVDREIAWMTRERDVQHANLGHAENATQAQACVAWINDLNDRIRMCVRRREAERYASWHKPLGCNVLPCARCR